MFAEWARSGRAVVHRRTSRTAVSALTGTACQVAAVRWPLVG